MRRETAFCSQEVRISFSFSFFVSILVIFDLETINYFVKAKMLIGHLSEHSYSDYCTHIPAIVLRRPNVLCMAHHTHHQQCHNQ